MKTQLRSDVEVAPGLRRLELDKAIRRIQHLSGLMLAFHHSGSRQTGFCYAVHESAYLVCVYAESSRDMPLEFSFDCNTWTEKVAIGHLNKAAAKIGCTYPELANALAHTHFVQFEGFVDGKPCRLSDNHYNWQALWGRIIETGPRVTAHLPDEISGDVARKLRRHAHEGQIVLDR
ncbi:MAG TPA: hypothetical protein VD967_03580 [Candidatus Paceibacterota bacterium]|nr:hypothetical protein [Candidatus Paceibacterota bacterium]